MPQWGKVDQVGSAVTWAAASLNLGSGNANQAANNTALFGNTTASAFISGQGTGQFGIDENEVKNTGATHTGWAIRREGTGGRAGRVTYEILVAGGITGDADGSVVPNYILSFTSQPQAKTANATSAQTAFFSVTAVSSPTGASLSYQWQANTGAGFANIANGGTYGNVTTSNVYVSTVTGLNGAQYRALVLATGANTITSNSAVLTVTT